MTSPVLTASPMLAEPDITEIRRYARCPSGADELIDECISEMKDISMRVCFAEFDVIRSGNTLDLGFAKTDSRDLARALEGCDRILLFASTIGNLPDRLVARFERTSPSKALFFQALGAERVEALCDAFCKEREAFYASHGLLLRPRFSPGYGDLPLEMQRDIFASLDCERKIGVTLSDSLLMIPSKSVTAIAGIRKV